MVFRVVSYNIKAGCGMDGLRSIARIAEVLQSLSPDVVCLQEVDQHMMRSWLANQPKYLGMRLSMQAIFQRNINYGVGGFGNCVLAKPKALHCRCHPLPGDGEPRGLLEVTAEVDGREVTVFCTHLSTEAPVRIRQSERIAEILRAVKKPKVLCGDMNDVAGSATIANLLADPALRDSATTEKPTHGGQRIDFVLPDLHFDVEAYTAGDSCASDHKPVAVDLVFA